MTHTDMTRASMALTDDVAQSAMFSRSAGLLSQTGNADAELKTRVHEEDAEDFRRLARSMGMNTSELLRIMILVKLRGVDGVLSITRKQLEYVSEVGPEKDPA